MTNLIKNIVKLDALKTGDTVIINNTLETVDSNYLKRCPFMGVTYKGQPYRNGIIRVTFKVPTKNGFRYQ